MRDKIGARISTATTNLDIHDIARTATTYDVACYWIVQPLASQRDMCARILRHWTQGPGKDLHPDRPEALARVRLAADLTEVGAALDPRTRWWATTARPPVPALAVADAAALLAAEAGAATPRPTVLLFGTGWGMAPEVLYAADAVLEPICIGAYNHLSVRSAVAIYLDRLWRAGRIR